VRQRVALFAFLVAVCCAGSPAHAGGPLRTAIFDPTAFASARGQAASFDRARTTGATMVRLSLHWRSVAPAVRPPSFDAGNPYDPAYNWGWFDQQVRLAYSRGLEPFVEVMFAPPWAAAGGEGTIRPDPAAFGQFARAAALRYSGSLPGLPRVRYWQAWGEPNRDYFLLPQYEGGRVASAIAYRELVNSFAAAVKSVSPSNVVIAGALSPIGRPGRPAPLAFMRELLCVSPGGGRTCDHGPVTFDVWAHHAYTLGGPTHRARGDNVSIGDLPKMRRLLRAAERAGHVRSSGPVGFWVTEFAWDTSPPDPRGLPSALHARWTSEALYRMWKAGVSMVTWWRIQDDPFPQSYYQSGFYTVSGRAKRSLRAFRFPVVAFRRGGGVYVWGRTPWGRPGRVSLQLRAGHGWRRLGRVRTNGHGIFSRTYGTGARRGVVRARFGRQTSVPFSLRRVRDRPVEPFGCGGPVSC
jgi:hypothetical protein